jgi:hypothetical protein
MRIGIVADIHEAIESLQQALDEFRARRVDVIVSLGDACDTYGPDGRSAEVAALLCGAGAVGVWGNHDWGLCRDVSDDMRRACASEMLEFMGSMQPHLVVEGCRFSHVEPWLDACCLEGLWYYDGLPDTAEKVARSFAAVSEQYLFIGHLHCWLAMTPAGRIDWNGETPLSLDTACRHLVVVAPVVEGWCAIFDTVESCLTPIRCRGLSA